MHVRPSARHDMVGVCHLAAAVKWRFQHPSGTARDGVCHLTAAFPETLECQPGTIRGEGSATSQQQVQRRLRVSPAQHWGRGLLL